MFSKALNLPADSLILDLEDSVAPDAKGTARAQVCDWLQHGDFNNQERLVRINPLDSAWGHEDLRAVTRCPLDGIVIPKAVDGSEIETIGRLLTECEGEAGLEAGSIPLCLIATESPAAVFNLAGMAGKRRVEALAWGAEDLATALGAAKRRDRQGNYLEVFQVVRSLCLLAARAAGVQPVDAPFVDYRDTDGLKRECELTASMGFTGKLTIHPDQIEIVNEAFMPSAEQISNAEVLLAAFEASQKEGRAAFTFQGEMVDIPHLNAARRVVERARQMQLNETGDNTAEKT